MSVCVTNQRMARRTRQCANTTVPSTSWRCQRLLAEPFTVPAERPSRLATKSVLVVGHRKILPCVHRDAENLGIGGQSILVNQFRSRFKTVRCSACR